MPGPITQQKADAVRELLSQGLPASRVATRLGVSQATVWRLARRKHRLLRKAKPKPKPKPKPPKPPKPKPAPPPAVHSPPPREEDIKFRKVKRYECKKAEGGCGYWVDKLPCVICAARAKRKCSPAKGTVQPLTP